MASENSVKTPKVAQPVSGPDPNRASLKRPENGCVPPLFLSPKSTTSCFHLLTSFGDAYGDANFSF